MNAICRHFFALIVLVATMVLGMGLAVMPASAGLSHWPRSTQDAPAASARGERVALLIGNSNYKGDANTDTNEWPRLQNAAKDANDIAKELKALGFLAEDIEVLNNATKDQIYAALGRLNKRAAKAKQVVFYFAGHGVQYEAVNYMIPVSARAKDGELTTLQADAVTLEFILDKVSVGQGQKVVMIDACRTTGGYRGESGGLANPEARKKLPPQTVVVFAAAANQLAADGRGYANGYFSQGLLEGLRLPNPSLKNVMTQATRKVASLSSKMQDVTAYGAIFLVQDDFLFGPVKAMPETIDPRVAEWQQKYAELLRNQQNQPTATRPQVDRDVSGAAVAEKLPELEGFVLVPGGVARDKKTGLEWMRCAIGQTWNGGENTCQDRAKEFTFKEAQQAAKDLNAQGGFAGKTNWRAPTVTELFGLVVCSKGVGRTTTTVDGQTLKDGCLVGYASPTIAKGVFPNTPSSGFWSSSPYVGYADYAWYVGFSDGSVNGYGRYDSLRVRLVR